MPTWARFRPRLWNNTSRENNPCHTALTGKVPCIDRDVNGFRHVLLRYLLHNWVLLPPIRLDTHSRGLLISDLGDFWCFFSLDARCKCYLGLVAMKVNVGAFVSQSSCSHSKVHLFHMSPYLSNPCFRHNVLNCDGDNPCGLSRVFFWI